MEYTMISLVCLLLAVAALQTVSADLHNSSISCYQCNSAPIWQGKSCASDSPKDLAQHLDACPANERGEFTRCRKMVQTVDDETRVIRSCATVGSKEVTGDRCVDRVGTFKVKVQYCECTNQEPNTPCNSAYQKISSPVTVMAFLLLTLASAFVSHL